METLIAVIGGSRCTSEEARSAEGVGRELARRGITVVCGGLGGVMEAAARGAAAEGGRTVGILPGNSPEDANPYIQIPIVTGMGYARNTIVVKSARAVIAVGGSFGTLSEIAFALQGGTPVVGIGTWELCRNGEGKDCIILAGTPEEAVDKALAAITLAAVKGGS
ncbi:MAG: TIGR00725 family protein [Dehalococcoidia bacterium]